MQRAQNLEDADEDDEGVRNDGMDDEDDDDDDDFQANDDVDPNEDREAVAL